MPLAPDVPAILRTLIKHRVSFVVIGGVAVAHHGYVRTTKDIDIMAEPSDANLRRLWAALQELDAAPLALQHDRPEELPEPFALGGLLKLGNWDLSTKHGRLDLLQYVRGKLESADDYAALARRSEETRFDFGVVRFVSYGDLLDMKTLAGRDQDLVDIRALREARGDIGPA
ncbi:MAG: hypothetical protein Q7S41_01520 [Candidatus Limnocylindria bacterium]|nr:hypothetical protein [Candidatus Limnocylindria bacterium]